MTAAPDSVRQIGALQQFALAAVKGTFSATVAPVTSAHAAKGTADSTGRRNAS
jgi:hypothetical protein